ncbi:hypothetical protein NA57DRAFT_51107 [Rhizodiscina lignyota]|uniref:Uncharacterized protein n=1 Tax=Rhizodiscina lignyota TaxID=1504668 RepID=A0A9P4IR55_9PEZI|nr:hypothetical protein NA57DRAFT_51107 [Rhizodiscina lignyota]
MDSNQSAVVASSTFSASSTSSMILRTGVLGGDCGTCGACKRATANITTINPTTIPLRAAPVPAAPKKPSKPSSRKGPHPAPLVKPSFVSQGAWEGYASNDRRRKVSHSGRISEGGEGEVAAEPCDKCNTAGQVCEVFTAAAVAAANTRGEKLGGACARCLWKSSACSKAKKRARADTLEEADNDVESVASLRARVASLKATLAERDPEIARLRAENENLRDDRVDSLGARVVSLNATLAERDAEIARLHAENENLRKNSVLKETVLKLLQD